MVETILFILGSMIIIRVSLPFLRHPATYGFYRFFAWEIILGLLLLNVRGWFTDPFVWHQILSWLLLTISIAPFVLGVYQLRHSGKPDGSFEATTHLVSSGIYRYIRHPLYASLLYLAWGIFFKSPSLLDGCLVVTASAFLFATARADETGCLLKFGQDYAAYMKTSKRFIPFIF